jgi:3-dehydroquinate dehydratase-2
MNYPDRVVVLLSEVSRKNQIKRCSSGSTPSVQLGAGAGMTACGSCEQVAGLQKYFNRRITLKILIINGPNLNRLGLREPEIYGSETLEQINREITNYFEGNAPDFFQSNHEGELINQLHAAVDKYQGIILNAGALTHYSYALRDAIASIPLPVIEVHLSNIQGREEFRTKSVIAPACSGSISGFGKHSYFLAIQALQEGFNSKSDQA